ncbi:MAG: Ig-like domain-containing protein [Oscillospiraceae bacterium]|nr:Ig-like domain-containing protein [Oscillospiraceae bacterium]
MNKRRFAALLFAAVLCTQLLPGRVWAQETPASEVAETPEEIAAHLYEDPDRFVSTPVYPVYEATPSVSSLTHNSRFADYMPVSGIDVSKFQGTVNWAGVATDDVDFAIIRVGCRGYDTGALIYDEKFEPNIRNAATAGLDTGVYFRTQAITTAEAVEEANFVIDHIKKFQVTMPVYFDIEAIDYDEGRLDNAGLSKAQKTALCEAFCSTIRAAGYEAGVYANMYWLNNMIDAASLSAKYPIWLANYTNQTSYTGTYGMWQFSSTGSVTGIDGNVDRDVRYSKKIHYSVSSLTLEQIGETAIPVITGEGSITYSSSAPGVAKVDSSGVITAVADGTAQITATSSNGSKTTLTVKVESPSPIELDYTKALLRSVGETVRIYTDPPSGFTFTSRHPSVATVSSDGTVTAAGFGQATIVVSDGKGHSELCIVTVRHSDPLIGDCNLDNAVNAIDASCILYYAARAGAKDPLRYNDALTALYDYDGSGRIDANDGCEVLIYSAKAGAGVFAKTGEWPIYQQKHLPRSGPKRFGAAFCVTAHASPPRIRPRISSGVKTYFLSQKWQQTSMSSPVSASFCSSSRPMLTSTREVRSRLQSQ